MNVCHFPASAEAITAQIMLEADRVVTAAAEDEETYDSASAMTVVYCR